MNYSAADYLVNICVLNCRYKLGFRCSCHGCMGILISINCKIWLYDIPMVIGYLTDNYKSLVPGLGGNWQYSMFNVWQFKLDTLKGKFLHFNKLSFVRKC